MILGSVFVHYANLIHFSSSKALLLSFLKSPTVSNILDNSEVNRILDFLRNHVFPHEHAVGARCNKDEFSTHELVAAYIQKVKDKTVALLSYSESEVSQTLMGLNYGMNAGFTQESHNCNNNSDWDSDSSNDDDNRMENSNLCDGSENNDDNPIAFSWDASETPEYKASTSTYAEAAPLCKELLQELDEASPSTRNYGLGILKGSIISLLS